MRELRRWSLSDAEAYEEYGQLMVEMAKFIKPILGIVPPDPTGRDPREFLPLAGLLRDFQRLPERQQAVFVQLMTMSAADFLDQWFETDPLKATMSASGIIGTFLGVRSPGTAYVLLHHYMGEIDGAFRAWGIPKGGTGGISEAIASAARSLGRGDPHRGARWRGSDRATAGRPASSSRAARRSPPSAVLASTDVRRTFLRLLEPGTLDAGVRGRGPPLQVPRQLGQGQPGASTGCPTSAACPARASTCAARSASAPRSTYMERAYDDAKYGHFSRRPYIDMIIPTLVDPTMAPPGKHVISCFVQYAPYKLDARARQLGRQPRGLRRHGHRHGSPSSRPNIRDIIVGRQVRRRSTSSG